MTDEAGGLVVGRAQIDEIIEKEDGRSVEPRILSRKSAKQPQTRKREMKRILMMPRAAAALRKTAYLDAHAGSTVECGSLR